MNDNFAKNLKKIRKEHNLSQEQLAEELGVSRQAISKWESSVAYPEMDKIITICKMYDVNIDDLLHRDITLVKNDEETNIKYNKLINTVFNNITDSIDMFIKLSFKNKVRLILENIILVCIFAIGMVIVNGLVKTLLHEMFEMLPYKIEALFVSVLTTVVLLAYLLFVIIILIRTFKTRYLDYYLANKNNNSKEEIDDSSENKKEVIKTEDKIIIRDPKNSNGSILKGLVNLFFFGVRVFNFFILLGVIGTLVFGCFCTFIALYHITVHPIFVSFTFLGVFGIAACIVFAIMLFGFIFKKKNNVKFLFILFLLAIVGASISTGSIFMNAAKFEVVEVNTVTNTQEISYNDDLYFSRNYLLGSNNIKFVIDDSIAKDKIVLESSHSDTLGNVIFNVENNVISCSIEDYVDRYEFNYKYKYIISYIKDNKIPKDTINGSSITIKGREANIKKLIANSTKNVISDVTNINNGYVLYLSDERFENYVCNKKDFYNECYAIIAEDNDAYKEIMNTTFTIDNNKLKYKNSNIECEENNLFDHKSFTCRTK